MGHVYIASGDVHPLRRRFVDDIIFKRTKMGWNIQRINASQERALGYALQDVSMLGGLHLFHVVNPEKEDLEVFVSHVESENESVILLLEVDGNPKGNTKFGKWVKERSQYHKSFSTSGKSWKLAEEAENVLRSELKRHGNTIDDRLIPVIVDRAGHNPGVMVFEALKYSTVAGRGKEVTPDLIRGLITDFGAPDVFSLSEAVSVRYAKRVAQLLSRIKSRSKTDPTIYVSRVLCSSVLTWIAAHDVRSIPAKDAAEQLEVSTWLYSNKILPAVRAWPAKELYELLRVCTRAERSVLEGKIDPWSLFSAGLLSLL